ncbi:MAG: hypothetical protein C0501_02025 [Isosphaera sp.]|nr:hypothetical protein [Isosphaera sp.]
MTETFYSHSPRPRLVPEWRELVSLTDEELGHYDIAAMNLACAAGLPGAEAIDVEGCLRWLDAATDLVRRWTEAGLDEFFRPNPAEFKNSEAYFRVLALASVLQRHCGVRFDASKIGAGPEVPFEFHEQFVHGVIQGPGGTCATLPVVYASIGRRLGYPIRLVCAKRHLFARWDDPAAGERFNIECSGVGFDDPPDDRYRAWPLPITNADEERLFGYLQSFSPRRELATSVGQRGFVLQDHKRYREAAECFCAAAELTPQSAGYPGCVLGTIAEWKRHLQSLYPPRFPRRIDVLLRPDRRRWRTVPWEVEKEMAALRVIDYSLNDPEARATWWDLLRQGRPPIRPVPASITADYDFLFPAS